MEAKINSIEYVKEAKHLPDFLKDFHDQKEFFHAMYEQWGEGETLQKINWTDAHIYTIDYFLWWMGLHGYKLQKIRSKDFRFYDPHSSIRDYNKQRKDKLSLIFKNK
jgi:hypothetical protein